MSAHTGHRAVHALLSVSIFAVHVFLSTAGTPQRSQSTCNCNDWCSPEPVLHQKNPSSTRTKRVLFRGTTLLGERASLAELTTTNSRSLSALCPLVCANGRTRVDLRSNWLSVNRLPGDLRWMAAVGGLQPVTSLSAGRCVHQGPSTYSSCSTSFQYDGTSPDAKAGIIPCLLSALYPISSSLSSSFDNYQAMEYNRSVCVMADPQEKSEVRNCREEPFRYHEKQ
jgi:hypothetical protein